MQDIIIEKPYKFVPPHRGSWLSNFVKLCNLHARWLRKHEGVEEHEIRGLENLQASLKAGHSIMLTPNHSRTADPMVMAFVAKATPCNMYAMASWHLFHQDWLTAWAIRMMGAFSVNREGVDRQAINMAISLLESAERPLVVYAEGGVSRTNDQLQALLDGVAFIARAAAKKRARRDQDGKVVVHPVAIKYLYQGDFEATSDPVLTEIEARLSWRPQRHLGTYNRIVKVGKALLTLKEIEYFGEPQPGRLYERLPRLIDRLLEPIENEWLGGPQRGGVIPRVKALRIKILPDMVNGLVSSEERARRWEQLADIYLAQQVASYPPDYLVTRPSVDRLLETIERYEEDLTDKVRIHGCRKVVIQIGDPIDVNPKRAGKSEADPLMSEVAKALQSMLDKLAMESRVFDRRDESRESQPEA